MLDNGYVSMHVLVQYSIKQYCRVHGHSNYTLNSRIHVHVQIGLNSLIRQIFLFQPLSKKVKKVSFEASVLEVLSDSEDLESEKQVSFLQQSFYSKKWSMGSILTLLEETADQSQLWIHDVNPL